MNNKKLFTRRKGQTMVEFALVLPVLLLIIFGLLEAGRLIFIYGSVVTASRQAVRYGSATGLNEAGNRKYLDCGGIETSAEDMGFILPVTATITYEHADGTVFANCVDDFPTAGDFVNGDRIAVETTSTYSPLVPLVPFGNFDITTSSKRTIFVGIVIMSTPGPVVPSPGMTFKKSAYEADGTTPKTGYTGPGDTVLYKYTIINTGAITLTSIEITDPLFGQVCTSTSLAQGNSFTCTAPHVYTITEADETLDNGEYKVITTSFATASYGTGSLNKSAQNTLIFTEVPALEISIIADPAYTTNIPSDIAFNFTITNTGNVPLSTFSIANQNLATSFNDCPAIAGDIQPGGTAVCTATYTIDTNDIDASGVITYTATMQAVYNTSTPVSPAASAEVNTRPLSLKFLSVTPNPYDKTPYKETSIITYKYRLFNNTAEVLNTPELTLEIRDPDGNNIPHTPAVCDAPLEANSFVICTGTYEIQQTDLDNGSIILANAIGSALQSGNTLVSNTVGEVLAGNTIEGGIVIDAFAQPAILIEVEVSTPDGTVIPDGEAIPDGTTDLIYTYTLTNDGNISLPAGTIYDVIVGSNTQFASVCTRTLPANVSVLPTYTDQCVRNYHITAEDFARGSIIEDFRALIASLSWTDQFLTAGSPSAISTIYTRSGASLRLEISATVAGQPVNNGATLPVGSVITYIYTFTNTGREILSPPYFITNNTGSSDCSSQIPSDLLPQASKSCMFTVTANIAGTLTKTASGIATLKTDGSTIRSETPDPSISFIIEAPKICNLSANWTTSGSQYSHTLAIDNQSGAAVTISEIVVTWAFKNLTSVTINGSSVLPSSTSISPHRITGLSNVLAMGTGNQIVIGFSHKNSIPTISIKFVGDPICGSYELIK